MSRKVKTQRITSLLMAVILIVGMIAMGVVPATAESYNDAVKEDANGILQIRTTAYATGKYNDEVYDNDPFLIASGTAFLINPNTIITCAHVINKDYMKLEVEYYGMKFESVVYEVVINKDVTITCSLENFSEQDDYAILTLNKAVGGKSVLKLGDSDKVSVTQKVYALGFPGVITDLQKAYDSVNVTYDRDDVTITEGDIQKVTSINNTNVIQHGCATSGGNSGGPLVDENGAVLGVHKWGDPEDNNSYHYATAINEVKKVLDSLLIKYTSADEPAPTVAEETKNEDVEETTSGVIDSTSAAIDANNDNNIAGNGSGEIGEKKDNTKMIIIIAIIALIVILIAVVIVIIVVSIKKKNGSKNGPQGGSSNPVMPPTAPNPPTPPQQNRYTPYGGAPTMPSNDGAGETSVLNSGAGETTVLGGNRATGFTLLRKSSNERININKPEFVIGKERRKVDYCIENNSSVSRTHAKIKVRSDKCYICDLGSTNCTYVNGSRLSPNQEVELKKGDKIKISDEEFEMI